MNTAARQTDKIDPAAAFFRWRPAAWLRVSGPDAFAFLQGQFTNDLRSLSTGSVYGLWLNQKGRVLADSFIRAGQRDEFWVGSYFSLASVIRERLEAYIIADDVVVEDLTADWIGLTAFGPGAADLAGALPGIAFPGRRGTEPCVERVFPAAEEGAIRARLADAAELSWAEIQRRRIRGRIPTIPVDIGPGELPNEGGLERTAISYIKGCYLGQEVIARLRSLGQVRRRLFLVQGAGALPQVPCALFQGGRKIGELRSVAAEGGEFVGLALLSLLNLRADSPLELAPEPGANALAILDQT